MNEDYMISSNGESKIQLQQQSWRSKISTTNTNDYSIHTNLTLQNVGNLQNMTIIIAPRNPEPEKLILKIPANRTITEVANAENDI